MVCKIGFTNWNAKVVLLHVLMIVTYYIKLFRLGADGHNSILISLLLLVTETISILKIPCVPAFVGKTDNFDFFGPNLPKNGFLFGNLENHCWNKNQHPRDSVCANFQAKWTTLTFLVQICPKMDFGQEIQKTNLGIKISILEIACVPIFR